MSISHKNFPNAVTFSSPLRLIGQKGPFRGGDRRG